MLSLTQRTSGREEGELSGSRQREKRTAPPSPPVGEGRAAEGGRCPEHWSVPGAVGGERHPWLHVHYKRTGDRQTRERVVYVPLPALTAETVRCHSPRQPRSRRHVFCSPHSSPDFQRSHS